MNKNRKVCIMTSVHPLHDTRVFYKQAQTLVGQGYDVHFVVPHAKSEIIKGIKVWGINKPKNRLERICKTTLSVFKQANRLDADIYHFHDPELIFVGKLLQMKGKKVIYDVHENVPYQIAHKDWVPFNNFVSKVYKRFESILTNRFPLVLAEESYSKYYLKKHGWESYIVQNFPSLSLFPPVVSEKEKYIVYLGGVSEVRGIKTTIEAINLLKKEGIKVKFKCIGPISNELKQELEEKIKEYNLEEQIHFYGRLNAPDAYKIVSKAQIGLAVLKPIPNYLESYPTKVFEYMALKVPFITSNFDLYKELVNETKAGITINPEDPSELAESIQYLLNNQAKREEMGENGRRAVEEKYNWEKESEKLLSLYEKLEKELQK